MSMIRTEAGRGATRDGAGRWAKRDGGWPGHVTEDGGTRETRAFSIMSCRSVSRSGGWTNSAAAVPLLLLLLNQLVVLVLLHTAVSANPLNQL